MKQIFLCVLAGCLLRGAALQLPDDTSRLQAQIDALPAGGTLRLESGTYRCHGLRIAHSVTILAKNPSSTFWIRDRAEPFLRISGRASDVTIQGLNLDGGGFDAAGIEALGIHALHLAQLRIEHCGVPPADSLKGDRFGKYVDGVYAMDVDTATVEHCIFRFNARDGFIGIPVRRLRFIQNEASGNGRMGCTSDVDPGGRAGGPLQVEYLQNEVSDCGTGGLHVESAKGLPVAEALFEGNRVTDCGNRDWGYCWGLVLGANTKGTIRHNTILGTGLRSRLETYRNGILLGQLGGPALVEDNLVSNSGRAGIALNQCPFPVRLAGNTVQGSGDCGITAGEVQGLQVQDCTVEGARRAGFRCYLCPSAELIGNRFAGNSTEGWKLHPAIRAEASRGLRVLDNDLGGFPQKMGLELDLGLPEPGIVFEGNRFEGRRSHPALSNFTESN